MAHLSSDQARRFIDDLRKKNGGMTARQREFLQREDPDILEMFESIRRKLGAATKTYALSNLYEHILG
jgi:hypothetical protein